LRDLVDGLLFSLQAEGRSVRTIGYYRDLLHPLLDYAWDKGWPDDARSVDSLRDDQMSDLNRLKEWLYKKRTQLREDRERAERRQKREEEVARRKAEQPALFEF